MPGRSAPGEAREGPASNTVATLLRDQTARYRAGGGRPRDLTAVTAEREQILDLCLAGDVDAAVAQLHRHFEAGREQVRPSLARRVRTTAARGTRAKPHRRRRPLA
jgi:DNA-binding GntR family transcriptional regulator